MDINKQKVYNWSLNNLISKVIKNARIWKHSVNTIK